MDWKTVEMLGYAYYACRGWRVLVSLVEAPGYDFVIEKDGVYKRVNVKMAGTKGPGSTAISQAGCAKRNGQIKTDVFLAYIPNGGYFIELPGDFFVNVRSKARCIPQKLLVPQR